MHLNGLATLTLDELHDYEEGLNIDAERLYLNWGEPGTVEKLMATTKALADKVILRNPKGICTSRATGTAGPRFIARGRGSGRSHIPT